ncbi:MAG: DUF3299 domain-containing protein [Deltaproteobacteria bacterium]|nr:DUF3299 domain-containing protein [Deltaproteobacteria bacterium]
MQGDSAVTQEPPKKRTWRAAFGFGAYLAFVFGGALWIAGSPETAEADLNRAERAKYSVVSWAQLTRSSVPATLWEEPRAPVVLPADVKALDGKSVALRGFVIPTWVEAGGVREFVLAAKNEIGCCFGDGLTINQLVVVSVPETKKLRLEPYRLMTVLGTLAVGEERSGEMLLSLYRMTADDVRDE